MDSIKTICPGALVGARPVLQIAGLEAEALSGPPRGVLHPQKRGAKPTRKPDRAAGSRLCRSVPGAGHPAILVFRRRLHLIARKIEDDGVLPAQRKMEVSIPGQTNQFEIPDDWWVFAEMEGFRPSGGGYYPPPAGIDFDVVPIAEVEPPARNQGVRAFDKFRLMPVLFAFRSPECALPAAPGGPYRFKVRNRYHRFYASIAAGFEFLPAVLS